MKTSEKLFLFDLETTGVKFWKNGIHQIAGAIIIDGEIKEHFDYKVQPNIDAEIEQEALDVGKVTREQIMSYAPMQDIYKQMVKMLGKYIDKFDKFDKIHLTGYNNAPFDNQFLRAWFKQNGDNYFGSWFWSDSIDVMCLASNYMRDKRSSMPNFKQSTVARELGIQVDESKLHNSKYDTEILYKIFTAINS